MLCGVVFAQQPSSPEDEAKRLREMIDAQIESMTNLLDLEDWQVFYVDSIMTHDYEAMSAALKALNQAKVSNVDMYERTQDEWQEKIYNAYQKVFDQRQWAKYLKAGAARDKKARDKRAAKRNK